MAGSSIRKLALLAAMAGGLSACANLPNPFGAKENPTEEPATSDAATSVRLVDRDVESPETFQTTDTALWDGRPSLGGVWVASPDVVNPERVILRNEENGKFVIGALFRRERDNPGPKLQISSDAAEALGMLAGQPGKLNVTALRREDSKAPAADPVATSAAVVPSAAVATSAAAPAKPGDVETPALDPTTVDPIAAAGAAIDRADGTTAVEGADAALIAAPTDDLDPTPRPGETKRAARKRARLAAKAAALAEANAASLDPISAPDGTLLPEGDAALAAPVPALEVAPLPDVAVAAPAAPTSGSARVQIGIFSVEANAQRAADTLKAGGVAATVRQEDSNGKAFWSVVASGDGGSKALLAKVKDLGFSDAYAVSG